MTREVVPELGAGLADGRIYIERKKVAVGARVVDQGATVLVREPGRDQERSGVHDGAGLQVITEGFGKYKSERSTANIESLGTSGR